MELGLRQRRLLEVTAELHDLRDSVSARLAMRLHRLASRAAPPGTRRQLSLVRLVRAAAAVRAEGPTGVRTALRDPVPAHRSAGEEQAEYDRWRRRHEPTWSDLNRMRAGNRAWTNRPLVSIVMPTFNSQPEWLRPAFESVLGQVYENWELCIADDASTEPRVAEMLAEFAATDSRVKVVIRAQNGGIAAASASALELASGEFIGLLDHDDLLRPHALHSVVERLQGTDEVDLVYSDEDQLLQDGRFGNPFFKPDWSPDFLLSVNYICHFLVLRRELVERTGGFRPGFDGAQDLDLLLRTTELAREIVHVPDVLYAWRQVPGSVALAGDAKMYAYESGTRAVAEALHRRGMRGRVVAAQDLGRYRVRLDVAAAPNVEIIIPTRDRLDLLRQCLESIEARSTYANYSITIVDNGSVEPSTLRYLERTRHRVIRDPGGFNYSRLVNVGRAGTDAPYLLTVNNDVTVISPDWIEALLEQVQRPEVGVAGGRLLYEDGRPQHEGIGIGNIRGGTIAANLDAGWMGRVIRNVSAVTGACQMSKTSVFDDVGGYDERLEVGFNDVDYCLRVLDAGHLVIYTPYAELTHRESATRGTLDPVADYEFFWDRWGVDGGIPDRYLSPHVRSLNPLELRVDPTTSDR
jgi:GT2 family glycosyltransferase